MNVKKMAKGITVIALLAIIAVGATLAYLTGMTETKTNTFTGSNNVKPTLEEKTWDETGKRQAASYKPGDAISKDPTMELESDSESAWVGMKLDFIGSDGMKMFYNAFRGYASYDTIGSGWVKIATNKEGSELYAYNVALTKDNSTSSAIFNKINVNAGITTVTDYQTVDTYHYVKTTDENGKVTEALTKIEGTPTANSTIYDADGNVLGQVAGDGTSFSTTLPKFEIAATGYAVQSANVTFHEGAVNAKSELIALANKGLDESSTAYFTAD